MVLNLILCLVSVNVKGCDEALLEEREGQQEKVCNVLSKAYFCLSEGCLVLMWLIVRTER